MNRRTENEFRVKPAPRRGKQARQGDRFITQVLREANRIVPTRRLPVEEACA